MSQTIHIDVPMLNKSITEYCECGCPFFSNKMILKKVSGILLGIGKDTLVPVNLLTCEGCGRIHNSTKLQYPGLEIPAVKEPPSNEQKPDGNNDVDAKVLKLSV